MTTPEPRAWSSVARSVRFVPAPFSRPTTPAAVAREMLRCDDDDLSLLVDHGLPSRSQGPDTFFDANDLYNLGMYSGRGDTQPERAFALLFRFMDAPVEKLTAPTSWTVELRAECSDCPDGADGFANADTGSSWRLAVPSVSRFGGSEREIHRTFGHRTATVTSEVVNGGVHTPVLSSVVRRTTGDLIESGLTWQMLPVDMQADWAAVHASGVTNCIAASLALAEDLRRQGHQATAVRGWFCGVLGGVFELPHAWVEVVDDDGALKAIDVATAMLARLRPDTDAFQDLCLGTPFNRVIASDIAADAPVALHRSAATPAEHAVTSASTIRRTSHTQPSPTAAGGAR